MKNYLAAALCGLLFGIGLVVSGMADPSKVLGFLTFAPGWDPSLMLVMGGALLVTVPGFWWLERARKPLLAEQFSQPAKSPIDRRLLLGAALFGAGWGLVGYCPGPALVGAGQGFAAPLLFCAAMLAGTALAPRANSA